MSPNRSGTQLNSGFGLLYVCNLLLIQSKQLKLKNKTLKNIIVKDDFTQTKLESLN